MIGMGEIKGFGDMKWQKSHELVLEVYKIGKRLSGLINSLKKLKPKT